MTTPAAILAKIPSCMCQKCGRAAATKVKIKSNGVKMHLCDTCFSLIKGPSRG